MSSPDMFNFYLMLANHDIVTDAGRTTTCSVKVKGPSFPTKCTKNEGPFENMIFSKKPFEDFNEKKIKYTSSLDQTTAWNTQPLKTTIENGSCKQ